MNELDEVQLFRHRTLSLREHLPVFFFFATSEVSRHEGLLWYEVSVLEVPLHVGSQGVAWVIRDWRRLDF